MGFLFWRIFITSSKNINVWSDGGIITTSNPKFYKKLNLLRNHGLSDRDTREDKWLQFKIGHLSSGCW